MFTPFLVVGCQLSEDSGRRSGRVAAQPFRQSAVRAFATLTLGGQ